MLILYVNHEILKQVSSAPKGGLISESFARWLQSPQKCAKHYPEHLLLYQVDRAQDSDLLEDWSRNEKTF